jgi:hypothetical protein
VQQHDKLFVDGTYQTPGKPYDYLAQSLSALQDQDQDISSSTPTEWNMRYSHKHQR